MNKYGADTDNALMLAIAKGDEQAFAELYHRYGRQIFRFFYRMLWRDAGRAEDFTQELFIKIIEKTAAYDPERPFLTWLYTLANNLCKNEYRRQARAPVDLRPDVEDGKAVWQADNIDQQLLETQLRAAIDALQEPHRQCFILRYQEELSVRDIALITGCPEGTVKSRLHYALQKVAADMQCTWGMNAHSDLYKNLTIKYL